MTTIVIKVLLSGGLCDCGCELKASLWKQEAGSKEEPVMNSWQPQYLITLFWGLVWCLVDCGLNSICPPACCLVDRSGEVKEIPALMLSAKKPPVL